MRRGDCSRGNCRARAESNLKRQNMKSRVFTFFLASLFFIQGCVICRHWNFGTCRESTPNIYSCSFKAPKFSAGVDLFLIIHRATNSPIPEEKTMRIRIQNNGNQDAHIQGIVPFVNLKPRESFEFNIVPSYESNKGSICSLDTHEGSNKITIDILSGIPKGATVEIVGNSCDGP